jgi:acylphosphatase
VASIHLRVRGRVQGIGFRWFVRVEARRLGLAGWVSNCPDGSVEIAASGDRVRLDELKRIVTLGPDGAHVQAIDELEPVGDLEQPFSVQH